MISDFKTPNNTFEIAEFWYIGSLTAILVYLINNLMPTTFNALTVKRHGVIAHSAIKYILT